MRKTASFLASLLTLALGVAACTTQRPAPEGVTRTGGTDWVKSIAFSPDGTILGAGVYTAETGKGIIVLWDMTTKKPLAPPLTEHWIPVESIAFSPDGTLLASADRVGIRVWDVANRKPLGSPLTGHKYGVDSVAFSPDGKMLASGGDDGIRLWDVTTQAALGSPLTGQGGVTSIAFSPDGKTLVSVGRTEILRQSIILWDVVARKPLGPAVAVPSGDHPLNRVRRLSFSPDGKTLTWNNPDNTVRLFDMATRKLLPPPLTGHVDWVTSVDFSRDGAMLASGSRDRTIILWDVATRRPLGPPLTGHQAPVWCVVFSPDGKSLASGGMDNTVRLWDISIQELRAGSQRSIALEIPGPTRPGERKEPGPPKIGPGRPGRLGEPGKEDLEKAVAALRHIDPAKLSDAEERKLSESLDRAWDTLQAAENGGVIRLKREIEDIDRRGERDHFFKLNAAAFLFKVNGLNAVEDIAKLWSATPLTYHYHYVFYTALAAAATQDARALPLLKMLLKDDQGMVHTEHMPIAWPLTHEFVWGVFGPNGLPVLAEILETSNDPVEIRSVLHLLSEAQDMNILPAIRKLTTHDNYDVRGTAIMDLGNFGHPQDYDFLVSGLGSEESKRLQMHIYALGRYGDLGAVSRLIPLLKSEDNETRRMVISALGELLTPASLEALHDHASRTENPQEAKMSRTIVENAVKAMNLSWAEYRGKTLPEKERLIKEVRVQKVSFGADERRLSREDLHRAAPLWIKGHRLPEWLKAKHLITGATPEDIDLLLEVKGAVLHRLSDECLYETRRIDDAIQWLGRSRYRKDPGVTERVEAR